MFSGTNFSFTIVNDTTAPSWSNGQLTLSNISDTSITFSWSGASDNEYLYAYQIYMDGEFISQIPSFDGNPDTSITLQTGVHTSKSFSGSHTFTVEAKDGNFNESNTGPSATKDS